ncbi:IS3 family transposase [Kordia sp.]|uniref:IS3 family transposase n=1 Tax=Kordia sp. TaxID=1965332 RepID=UPI003B59F751
MWYQTIVRLKQQNPKISVGHLCGLFGKTRQAYYEVDKYKKRRSVEEVYVLEMVAIIRREQPKIGTVKLYRIMQDFFDEHQIKMGRDALHSLLSIHGLIIKRKRRYVITTYSKHWLRKYDNLIKDITLTSAEQLWVSDITYIALVDGFNYLSLVTDGYSRKIVGYCLHETLESDGCIKALKMALETRITNNKLIHHSDRGIQYCSAAYVKILNKHNIAISMTEKGSPYENAIAERINGILKYELGLEAVFDNREDAVFSVTKAIYIYNSKRPHMSCDMQTPNQAHAKTGILKKHWKNNNEKLRNTIIN